MATVGTPGAIQSVPPTAGSYGQGIRYPMAVTTQGRLALDSGPVLVEQQIQSIIEGDPGCRPMLPQLGAAVGEFEPSDMIRLVARIKQQIAEYIPAVESVDVIPVDGPGQGQSSVAISYLLKNEDTERTLTYPLFSI